MTTDINGDYRAAYTYGLEEIGVEDLMEIEGKPNNPLYYLQDAIGSVTAITNMNSEVIDSNRFAPYGEALDPVAKNARLTNSPYGFTGEMHDIEGDLVYLRARYYSPNMMRFIQQDTYLGEVEEPLSRNLYAYGNGNPLKYVDPSGHSAYSASEGVGGSYKDTLKVPASKVVLKLGSKGEYVTYLQILLNRTGAGISTDGDFGPLTDAAVRKFQSSKKLAVDGEVGPITWGALESPNPVNPTKVVTVKAADAKPKVGGLELSTYLKGEGIRIVNINGKQYYDYSSYIKNTMGIDKLATNLDNNYLSQVKSISQMTNYELGKHYADFSPVIEGSLAGQNNGLTITISMGLVQWDKMAPEDVVAYLNSYSGGIAMRETTIGLQELSGGKTKTKDIKGGRKAVFETIQEEMLENGAKWKSDKVLNGHVAKRIKKGHIPDEWTAKDYNNKIKEVMGKNNLEVYEYVKSEKTGQLFDQKYYIYGDGEWVVMVGENGVMETAFSPDAINGGYSGYLKSLKVSKIK